MSTPAASACLASAFGTAILSGIGLTKIPFVVVRSGNSFHRALWIGIEHYCLGLDLAFCLGIFSHEKSSFGAGFVRLLTPRRVSAVCQFWPWFSFLLFRMRMAH